VGGLGTGEARRRSRRGKESGGGVVAQWLHEPAVVRVGSGRRQPPHRTRVRVADAGCASARVIFCRCRGQRNGTRAGSGTSRRIGQE
jgi:hypothetical protein